MQKAIKEEVNGLQQPFNDIDKDIYKMDFESQTHHLTTFKPNAQEVRDRTQDEKTQIIEYI